MGTATRQVVAESKESSLPHVLPGKNLGKASRSSFWFEMLINLAPLRDNALVSSLPHNERSLYTTLRKRSFENIMGKAETRFLLFLCRTTD